MSKVTITLVDKDDGSVGIVFNPSVKEINEAIMKAEISKDFQIPASFAYATRAVRAFLELNKQMKKTADKSGKIIVNPMFGGRY